jgi:zinc D-Ala-D-Ala carboxypeptidase
VVGAPIYVSSFFRSAQVNKAVGGSMTSQHCKGEAIDIDCDVYGNGTNKEVFEYIKNHLPFDQLIWEFGTDENPAWVHVSLRRDNKNRKQVLKAVTQNGRTVYKPFDK